MERAALYIRVSTEEQAMHGYSLEAQRDALTQYAHKHDMLIVDYYTDEGFSARKTYTTRPACVRMLEDVKAGKIDTILFIKLDRWFRNVKDYYKVQEILEKYHVNWKTIFEDYDTSTTSGRLHINIALSIAQDESDRTSDRIKFVFANKIQQGQFASGTVSVGYRLENKRLMIDEEKAELVREIFQHYAVHKSKYATIKFLREERDWNITQVTLSRLLSNTLYVGEYKENLNYCPPIIERQLFNIVQEIADSRNIRRPATGEIYLFSSMLICAQCRHVMTGTKKTNSQGKEYLYYRCNHYALRKLCNNRSLTSETKLEQYLIDNLSTYAQQLLKDYPSGHKRKKKNSQAEREKLAAKLTRLKDLYVDGLIDKDTYRQDYSKLQEQLATIPNEDNSQPSFNRDLLIKIANDNFLGSYFTQDRQSKQAFWHSVIKNIVIDSNQGIEIIFY